jgi:hypothetical protein
MSKTKKIIWFGLASVLAFSIYVFNFGLWPRYFDIAWDEEVNLHDGKIIVVHIKRKYERLKWRLSRYDNLIFRENEITWKVQGKGENIKFRSRLPICYLGKFDDKWFVVLSGQGPYGNHQDEMSDHWGNDFTTLEQRLAILENNIFHPVSWNKAPPELVRMNLTPSIPPTELSIFEGKLMTISEKVHLEKIYATSYRREVARPLRMQENQGESK